MTMLTKRLVGLAAFGGAVYLGWRALPQKTRDAVGQAIPVTVVGIGLNCCAFFQACLAPC